MKKLFLFSVLFLLWGGSSVEAAYDPSALSTKSSISAIQLLPGVANGQAISALGYLTPGDGGGGMFVWSASSTAATNACTVFAATGITTGRWLRQLSPPYVLPLAACGAIPNDLANDYTTQIQGALAWASSQVDLITDTAPTNSVTILCNGKYKQSAQIIVKAGVTLDGSQSRYGCYLYPTSNFTGLTTSGAVRIGDGTGAVYNALVRGVSVVHYTPGIRVDGSIDFYTSDCQDKCGFSGSTSNGYSGSAFVFDGSGGTFGSVNSFVFERNEAFGPQSGAVTGPSMLFKNGSFPAAIFADDSFCYVGHCPTNAMQFTGIPAVIYSASIEGTFTNGIQIDSNVPYGQVLGATVKDATTSLHISTVNPFTASGIYRINGTNVLIDDGGAGYAAVTLTQLVLPFYSRAGTNYFTGITQLLGSVRSIGSICNDFSSIICRFSISVDSSQISHIAALNNKIAFDTGTSGTTNRANVPVGGGLQVVPATSATVLAVTCNAGAEGLMYPVMDANSATFNTSLASGGSNHVIGYCNGTSWVVH